MSSDDMQRLKSELQMQAAAKRRIKWIVMKSKVSWLRSQFKFRYPLFERVQLFINLALLYWLHHHHQFVMWAYLAFMLLMPDIELNKEAISKKPGPDLADKTDSAGPDDLDGYMKRVSNQARKQ